jgi:hypothetical protein
VQNKINFLKNLSYFTYYIYFIIPFVLTYISILLSKLLSKSIINKVIDIEVSNNNFLANYLAFFFVALSIKDMTTFWIVFIMILIFTYFSRVSYFNPIFLVYGYNFYYIRTGENIKIMLITKQKLKNPKNIDKISVKRINDYTYIEV